jgi:hypothetical protein
MTFRHCHSWLCAIYIAAWPNIAAGQSIAVPAPTQQATAVALRIDPPDSIAIDGVFDEAAWERAEPIGNFTQSEPRNGEHETERTEIRILFSEDNLYVDAQFFDSVPAVLRSVACSAGNLVSGGSRNRGTTSTSSG